MKADARLQEKLKGATDLDAAVAIAKESEFDMVRLIVSTIKPNRSSRLSCQTRSWRVCLRVFRGVLTAPVIFKYVIPTGQAMDALAGNFLLTADKRVFSCLLP